MTTLYIDPVEYLQRYLVLEEKNTKTSIGHIHLKVGDITEAKKFYVDALGFDITAELSQALFISVGGYHHHIGLNTWESFGAKERTESLGLKNIQFMLSNKKEYDSLKKKLKDKANSQIKSATSFMIKDPWNNQITVSYHSS
jgi:catechol 2,3-dioxygenase